MVSQPADTSINPELMGMYRNILLQQHDQILDSADKITYKFWYRSVGGLGMLTMASFPYILYLTLRLKKVKNFSNKLAVSTMIQFSSLLMLIKAGHKFEEHEKSFVQKYFAGLTIDHLKNFDVRIYKQGGYHNNTNIQNQQLSPSVYGTEDNF